MQQAEVVSLAAQDRTALARLWADAARQGAADVAGLAELALVLAALGAPLELVERAARTSAEQAASTRAARGRAEAYAGVALPLPALPGLLAHCPGGVRRPRAALRRLALRALRDGCLLGGHAAQVTCWAAATCTDPGARVALAVVADAEARAGVLWADVLTWCLAQRPRLAVRLRKVDLPETSPLVQALSAVRGDPRVLAAHGWPRPQEVARMWAAHRAAVVDRLADPAGARRPPQREASFPGAPSPTASVTAAAHWA